MLAVVNGVKFVRGITGHASWVVRKHRIPASRRCRPDYHADQGLDPPRGRAITLAGRAGWGRMGMKCALGWTTRGLPLWHDDRKSLTTANR